MPFIVSAVNSLEFCHIGGTPERFQIELKQAEDTWFLNIMWYLFLQIGFNNFDEHGLQDMFVTA